jgi:hypothetical protein
MKEPDRAVVLPQGARWTVLELSLFEASGCFMLLAIAVLSIKDLQKED